MADGNQHVVYVLDSDVIMYHYYPSVIAASVLLGVFGISAILHTYQLARTRALYMIPLMIGIICEVIGYIGRLFSATEAPKCSLPPYIIQAILILIAPALFAASIYMMLGYIIEAVDREKYSPIQKKWLTKFFILGDVLSLVVQSNGAGLVIQKSKTAPTIGKWIVVGGLAIQIGFFGYFMLLTYTFSRRITKEPTHQSQDKHIPWRLHSFVLLAASVLIFVRSIIRVIEYVQGKDGYLLSHEIWLYIFDAVLMAIVVLLFTVVHPSQISGPLKGKGAVYQLVRVVPTVNSNGLGDEEQMVQRT